MSENQIKSSPQYLKTAIRSYNVTKHHISEISLSSNAYKHMASAFLIVIQKKSFVTLQGRPQPYPYLQHKLTCPDLSLYLTQPTGNDTSLYIRSQTIAYILQKKKKKRSLGNLNLAWYSVKSGSQILCPYLGVKEA